uniref:Malonamoyl-CoA synthetase vrtB n=1 Tax=Penicillium aethiopicum TaxID=36650 RepID=VRTB_PENAE|nr:RecName: Full=Malonamoyl-CoA synthetase vrtB; AltName: Full=Viridicatumtoxin synthesis protein B [Penicillium aethiopicum]ADI24927.1 VrtB [Penicillium aethiopicum]
MAPYLQHFIAWFGKDSILSKLIQIFNPPSHSDSAKIIISDDDGRSPEPPGGEEILWRHSAPKSTQMWAFLQKVNKKYGYSLRTYQDLHHWSITHRGQFWGEAWDYCGIRHSRQYDEVVDEAAAMWPRPAWFRGARLNFAENLLFPKVPQAVSDEAIAVISVDEGGKRDFITWQDLRERVRRCQSGMRALKIQPSDRVAGYVANHSNALVAMLATASLGAIWTAVSPDTGVIGAVDRLVQIEPRLLFTDNAVIYNGRIHPVLTKTQEIITALPSLEAVVVMRTVAGVQEDLPSSPRSPAKRLTYNSFLAQGPETQKLEFVHMPAEHPLYILYSSGTTGPPKCIVHGAIGTLMQHKKEHMLQSDIQPGDRLCFVTTCMWMMWHWLVSGLASGATVVLYNGSPFYYAPSSHGTSAKDDLAMPKLVDELGITQFGASATYFSMLERRKHLPRSLTQGRLSLETLKAVYSTGSPLAPSTFRYIYQAFGSQVNLGSISGGTDIIADFGVPSPLQAVVAGEIQVIALGMAVQAWGPTGMDLSVTGEPGELVQFWGPSGASKYESSYFAKYPGVWAHGDHIQINPRTGGLIMLGRSDGTLNPKGVRFGSAEIYHVLQYHFAAQVEDALCVGRRRRQDTDEMVVLFVKMRQDQLWSLALAEAIRRTVREELSPRHVPELIIECPEIPVTANGKKVEVLVKRIVSGVEVPAAGGSGTVNADCLQWFQEWATQN